MPTVLGLLNLTVPSSCQGKNLSAALQSGQDDGTDALPLFYLPLNWRGIYSHRYTYSFALHDPDEAHVPGGKKTFNVLYDRQVDPSETRNLFDDPASAPIKEQLHRQTLQMMAKFNDGGLRSKEIIRQVIMEQDLPALLQPLATRPEGWNARLKGRPVDLLPTPNSRRLTP